MVAEDIKDIIFNCSTKLLIDLNILVPNSGLTDQLLKVLLLLVLSEDNLLYL